MNAPTVENNSIFSPTRNGIAQFANTTHAIAIALTVMNKGMHRYEIQTRNMGI